MWKLWGIVRGVGKREFLGTFTDIDDMCAARHTFAHKYGKGRTRGFYAYTSALCGPQYGEVL